MDDQAASRLVLDGGRVITKCDQCRELYSERNPPQEPPCDSCRVILLPANAEAAAIYRMVRGQVITMFNGERSIIVDVNHQSIHLAMDRIGVKDQIGCFDKVVEVFHSILKGKQNG